MEMNDMTEADDLPRLSGDDWLDLRDGGKGVVAGRLDCALKRGHGHVMVMDAGWETTVVAIPGGYEGRDLAAGVRLRIVASRTEDGLETTTDEIRMEEMA
jgi:hypothetical protein